MIYICVLNYNNADDTISCLDSIRNLNSDNYMILLVDNASSSESREALQDYAEKHSDKIVFFPLEVNRGYAAGNNVALRYAISQPDMEFCWILNNDTIVEKNALYWLMDYMKKHKDVGLCGSKLIYSWDRNRVQGYGGKYRKWVSISETIQNENDIDKMDFVIGASVFVRKEFLEDVGLMCEDYFLYFEELDWTLRGACKYKISCEPRSIVYHKEGATIGANVKMKPKEKSELADYYDMRNRLFFTRKFYPYCLPSVYLISLLKIINRFRRKQFRRSWMFIKLLFGIRDERIECK